MDGFRRPGDAASVLVLLVMVIGVGVVALSGSPGPHRSTPSEGLGLQLLRPHLSPVVEASILSQFSTRHSSR